jgi:hypothetical protein
MNEERVKSAAWNVLGAMDALGQGDMWVCRELREALIEGYAVKSQEDEEYAHYVYMGGTMARGQWEHVRRLHMQYIESDRLSPYEAELML